MTTIKLTVNKTAESDKIYYLTGFNNQEKEVIFKHKENSTLQDASNIIGINCVNIIKLGKTLTSKPASISNYVGYFYGAITDDKPKLNINRPKQYRNYKKSEQQQESIKHLVDLDLNEITSAKTALKIIKEEYVCLWWDYNKVNYDTK